MNDKTRSLTGRLPSLCDSSLPPQRPYQRIQINVLESPSSDGHDTVGRVRYRLIN